jgi:hypothetical protein
MLPGLIRRPLRALAIVLLLVLVGAGLWAWDRARSSTPVSEDDAIEAFRDAGGAAGEGARGIPRPGVYTYRQEGSERGGAGPIGVSRDLPDRARYLVTLSPGGYAEELDISEQHVEGVRFRVVPRGTEAVWRRTKITYLSFGRDDRRDLRPAALHLPRPLRVGLRWTARYMAGDVPVSVRGEVLRREPVEIGGVRIPALVVRTVADTGGPHPGTRVETRWWSPSLSLPLRWTIDMDIGGPVTLDSRAELTLESTSPLT